MFPPACFAAVEEMLKHWRKCERLAVHERWRMDNEQMEAEQFLAGEQWTDEQIKQMRARD